MQCRTSGRSVVDKCSASHTHASALMANRSRSFNASPPGVYTGCGGPVSVHVWLLSQIFFDVLPQKWLYLFERFVYVLAGLGTGEHNLARSEDKQTYFWLLQMVD